MCVCLEAGMTGRETAVNTFNLGSLVKAVFSPPPLHHPLALPPYFLSSRCPLKALLLRQKVGSASELESVFFSLFIFTKQPSQTIFTYYSDVDNSQMIAQASFLTLEVELAISAFGSYKFSGIWHKSTHQAISLTAKQRAWDFISSSRNFLN